MTDPIRNAIAAAKGIQADVDNLLGPPEEGLKAAKRHVLTTLVKGTRGYIEKIANQATGSYQNGWYDCAAVMIRRLLETLIIEAFEKHQIDHKIKNSSGDFFYLRDLIELTLKETAWNLGRNARHALPTLKDLGDKSAHSRRYNAVRGDIDPHLTNIRTVVEELLYISGLRK
ncbi:MAG: hypothetical protein ACOZAM_06160 [Pseudomonadota bacterium]